MNNGMFPRDNCSRLLLAIFEAVEDSARWQTFLEGFTQALNSNQSALMLWTHAYEHNAISCYTGATEEDRREFLERWATQDPWVTRAPRDAADGVFYRSHEITPDEILEKTEMYQQYLKPRCWHYGGSVILLRSPSLFSMLSTTRAKEKGPITDEEREWVGGLIPFLRTAVRLHEERSRMKTELDASRTYLDHLSHGLAMVGREGHLLVANRRMQSILGSGDGLLLRDHRLCGGGDVGREIAAWLRGAAAGSAAKLQLAVPRPSGLRAYWLTLAPIPRGGAIPLGGAQPIATITAVDPESRAVPDAAAMTAVFGLTPAECRFARLLAGDRTMQEAAQDLGISPQTAKTHLKRILSKTGARRQSEMISVLLSIGNPEQG